MTTPELLAACRAALAEQKAVEAAAHPVPWVDLTESLGSIVSNPPGNEAYSDVVEAIVDPDDAAEIVQSRNADAARLEVAGKLIDSASSAATEMNSSAWTDFYLTFAAQLLGVAVD